MHLIIGKRRSDLIAAREWGEYGNSVSCAWIELYLASNLHFVKTGLIDDESIATWYLMHSKLGPIITGR